MAAAKEIRRMGERANELQAQITELSDQGKDVDALLNEYGQVQDRFEHLGGYELESNARKILSGLGFKVTDFDLVCLYEKRPQLALEPHSMLGWRRGESNP